MSESRSNDNNSRKRNLPSWMSSRENENDDGDETKQARTHHKANKDQNSGNMQSVAASASHSVASDFSNLMDGVVFVLSGFVNPERGVLRSRMLEMGAEYQPDWNSKCTLLICAFPNTPKFRQVEADCGTIVSKDWIFECCNQRKLVDIDTYLLHAGKPWSRQRVSDKADQDKPSTSRKSTKQAEKDVHSRPTSSTSSKEKPSEQMINSFKPLEVKKWAFIDFKNTLAFLEDQDEKPDPGEIKKIAADGVLTCLQDAIESLEQGQDIRQIAEQWAFVPRVVEELVKLDSLNGTPSSPSKKDLCKQAMECKEIYEKEFSNLEGSPSMKGKESQTDNKSGSGDKTSSRDDNNSDETIEMTEEEIDEAYNSIACSVNAKGISQR